MFYVEITPIVIQYLVVNAHVFLDLKQGLKMFFQDVVRALLSGNNPYLDKTQEDILVDSVEFLGGLHYLRRSQFPCPQPYNFSIRVYNRLTPDVFHGRSSWSIQALTRYTITRKYSRANLPPFERWAYDETMRVFVNAAIDTFVPLYSINPSSNHAEKEMLDLIKLCFDMGVQSQNKRALDHMLTPPPDRSIEIHTLNCLVPFINVLAQFLKTVQLGLTNQPFNKFVATVLQRYVDQVVGQQPSGVCPTPEQIKGLGCACATCVQFQAFLSDAQSESRSVSSLDMSHVEEHFATATKAWDVRWEVQYRGRRSYVNRSLLVTKPQVMLSILRWRSSAQTAKTILVSLGDPQRQAEILGDEYDSICARIGLEYLRPEVTLNPIQ
ncbi:hypothetical protein MIND_01323200 [Mycena indigotica]|uniref:Uncharacterized protein n=1 Tax=Mycena indigotica TaxID=2126181 RepID=A0A8H6S241_9AGAR|nr:uncharacterized protein MIND_01323200 [Mycena indigotica]KAF7290820.1 hypothetical protein MIND_01323200 [Mycena indigotica]